MTAGNRWFRVWPQLTGSGSPVTVAPPRPAETMKTVSEVLREAALPSKFVQMIPFDIDPIAGFAFGQANVKFDSDLPFRMDAVVLQFKRAGVILTNPGMDARVSLSLPTGRLLTRSPIDPSAFNGLQGGRDFIPYRYRFRPNDMVNIEVSNISAIPGLTVTGFIYGYKLTGEDRQ